MLKRKQQNKEEDNFLLYVPIKIHDNWIEDQNIIHLIFEHNKPIERFAAWLVKKPTITEIKLDELGSKVWLLMDGCRSVYDIGQILVEDFGSKCEPVYDRLVMYLHYLYKRSWIKFNKPVSEEDESISVS